MTPHEQFSTLGIEPTSDLAAVKAAYFARLKVHSPQRDPEGFRRLRAAYEALRAPGALAVACAACSGRDVVARYSMRFDAKLAEATREALAMRAGRERARLFVDTVSPLTLDEATRRFRSP